MLDVMGTKTAYSAQEPLIGYLYQCRLALLEALKRLKNDPDISIFIEGQDDICFHKKNGQSELIQVKHHTQKNNLTSYSPDIWKTIKIWLEYFNKNITEENTVFYLVTTETCKQDSAAYFLRSETRDINIAENILLEISKISSNISNKESYEMFNALTAEQRISFLNRVYIFDNSTKNKDIQQKLLDELRWVCDRKYEKQFLNHLEGWWINRISALFDGRNENLYISGREIDGIISSLRENFKLDSLPIHPEIKLSNPDTNQYINKTFVKQLKFIEVGEKRICRAITNFYKASEQRLRWIREDLIIDSSLEEYDAKLIEEWEIRFEQEKDSLSCGQATEREKIESGKKMFGWVETDAHFPIRPNCDERFITRGSYQILADRLKVGWHPDYQEIFPKKVKNNDESLDK